MIELRAKRVLRPDQPPSPDGGQRSSRSAAAPEIYGRLVLPFELRQKTRLRTRLASGEEVALMLPRGEVLRGGDLLLADDGRVVEVVAEPEQVLHITCETPQALTRAAYHLGNRHVAVQVGDGFLRIVDDHVLRQMLHGLGAHTAPVQAPFEPEAGAYGGGHSHAHGRTSEVGGARIHHYGGAQGLARSQPSADVHPPSRLPPGAAAATAADSSSHAGSSPGSGPGREPEAEAAPPSDPRSASDAGHGARS